MARRVGFLGSSGGVEALVDTASGMREPAADEFGLLRQACSERWE